jgi:hypothetical protein
MLSLFGLDPVEDLFWAARPDALVFGAAAIPKRKLAFVMDAAAIPAFPWLLRSD